MVDSDLNDFFSARPRNGDGLRTARQALESLLRSRALRSYRFARRREIGPYLVDYVCCEHSLILELQGRGAQARDAARTAFLHGLGYRVLQVCEQEVTQRPQRVLERIRGACG